MNWRPAALFAAPVIAAIAWVALRKPAPPTPPPPPAPSSRPVIVTSGQTTVAVFDDGNPAPNRRVVFHADDGSILHSIETGADGKAKGPIINGAMITVAYGTSARQLISVAGVQANEEVLVGEAEDEGEAAKVICTALVSIPALPEGAVKAVAMFGTGTTEISPNKPLSMQILERYLEAGRFRVFAEAEDAQGNTIGWTHAWVAGCPSDAGVVEVKLEAWKKETRPFAIAFSNAGNAEALHTELSVRRGDFDRFLRRKNELRPPYGKETRFDLPAKILEGETSLAYRIDLFTTSPFEWAKGPIERTVLAERMPKGTTPPETLTIDFATRMLPRVAQPALETTSDPARPFVSFRVPSREGPNAAPIDADVVIVRLNWPRTREHSWTLILPPNGPRRVRLPALPDTLKQWRPDGRDVTVSVGIVDASAIKSFDEVRKKGIEELSELDEGSSIRWSIAGEADF